MSSEQALELLRLAVASENAAYARDLLTTVEGPLRSALTAQLGRSTGGLVADRIAEQVAPRSLSGVHRAVCVASQEPSKIGVVETDWPDRDRRLLAGLAAMGYGAIALNVYVRPHLIDTSSGLDAFVVPSDLSGTEARTLRLRNLRRDRPAPIVVWPRREVSRDCGEDLPEAVWLMEASFALLARTLNERLSEQRASSDAMVRPSETEIDDARREQRRQSA